MKCVIPEISWHNRDPVLSVDIQPLLNNTYRLASGGGDCHVLIWLLKILENGATDIEAVADLTRHQRAVNVVRWSHSGQYLASADDDANIIIWQMKTDNAPLLDGNTTDKEMWVVHKILRGHKEDIYDICWSPDDTKLLSGSIDNTAIIWDFSKGKLDKILSDHKGFVQGVSWDPKNEYLSTASSDRICRVFAEKGKTVRSRMAKGLLPVPEGHPLFGKQVKYFHDDTFKSYFRRLQFSPDGNLLVVPAGCVETDDCKKALNAAFVFTLDDLKEPVAAIPTGKQCSVCVRFCPLLFELRPDGPDPVVALPYRMILAVATDTDVIIYDTQQTTPIAYLQRIHYTRLTDISWSKDGLLLVASSTDGFCTVVSFEENELGVVYEEEVKIQESIPQDVHSEDPETATEEKPKLEIKKRPTILDQWTIKTPKRKLDEDPPPNKRSEITNDCTTKPNLIKESPTPTVNKLIPKRVKPVQIVNDSKSQTTVKQKPAEKTEIPKKRGTILNFVKSVEKTKASQDKTTATLVSDEEARDAWKCQNESPDKKTADVGNTECIDLTEESVEDFKLEISVSQSDLLTDKEQEYRNSKETKEDKIGSQNSSNKETTISVSQSSSEKLVKTEDKICTVQGVEDFDSQEKNDNKTAINKKEDESEKSKTTANTEAANETDRVLGEKDKVAEGNKKIENKENEQSNSAEKSKSDESTQAATSVLLTDSQPPIKKPRRVELITLSSPRSKKKS